MIVFTDQEGCIKDVNTTSDTSLIEVRINDEENPFKNWSIAKICCYRVTVQDGIVTMMTPYVDSRLIEHIDELGKENYVNSANIDYVAMMSGIDIPTE